MKRLSLVLLFFSFSVFLRPTAVIAAGDFTVENFESKIALNKDTSLTIQETIEVEFHEYKHGIFRIIPVVYSAHGKTIKAKLDILSVVDEVGTFIPHQTSRLKQSVKIKIGDPDKTIIGPQIYVIIYQIGRVVLQYPEHDEIYWNVTGSEWDTVIEKASAIVDSPFAKITQVDCFSGIKGTKEKFCTSDFSDDRAEFESTRSISWGKDLTIVVGLSKNSQLVFPGQAQKIFWALQDNWGYPVALGPLIFIVLAWYQKGRDKRYLSGTVFYKPEEQKIETVPIFAHEHLPMVYSPIDKVTPSQVGTIIDEKVDIHDVVAEIVELARLGFLEIKKTKEKGLARKKKDYIFIKKGKRGEKIKDYQKFLLESIFEGGDEVKLSELKNKFYKHLPEFKKKLYQSMSEEGIFAGNPEKVRGKWLFIGLTLEGFALGLIITTFTALTANFWPVILLILSVFPIIVFARSMPRRKAWGYSLFRQITGLHWYLDKGKWREEIAEKHLFFEEILPLAISLGLVKKLAKDMAILGVKPPDYFTGVAASTFAFDFNSFNKSTCSALVSAPGGTWSGKSSWSGGSGFSGGGGGSSGGGFGGGGGGSW